MIKYIKLRDSLTKETELVTTSTILNVYNISKKKKAQNIITLKNPLLKHCLPQFTADEKQVETFLITVTGSPSNTF